MFKYEEITEYITDSIENKIIEYGAKLPSIRSMSQKFNCALSVVMQAYYELENLGIIYSVEKSGFYVSASKNSPIPTSCREIYSLKREEARPISIIGNIVEASNDKTIIPLGAGIPHDSLLPLNSLKQSLNRVLKENYGLLDKYTDEAGSLRLRVEICKLLLNRNISIKPEDLIITNGCIEAISLAIQALSSPGDTIAIESPLFMGTIQLLKELKRNIIMIPTSPETGMDLDILDRTIEKEDIKAIIMTAAFQNPLGFVMPVENRIKAIEISSKYNIPIIEDDLYSDCSHNMIKERPLKSFDKSGNVIYCSSFSKTISPGIRVGWLSGGKYHKRCRNIKVAETLGGSSLVQEAVSDFLSRNGYDKQVKKLQKAIAKQAAEIKILLEEALGKKAAISSPKGGLFFWVELNDNTDALEVYKECLKERISIVPGQAFSSGERFLNCFRVSFASPVTDEIKDGIKKLGQIISKI